VFSDDAVLQMYIVQCAAKISYCVAKNVVTIAVVMEI
jgi:hypothetical protein